MDKMISCKDFESECTFTACAGTEAELFEKILEHGRTVHRAEDSSPDIYGKVRASIKEGYCDWKANRANMESAAGKTKEDHCRLSSIKR
jgi:predicted small metal-binding protein